MNKNFLYSLNYFSCYNKNSNSKQFLQHATVQCQIFAGSNENCNSCSLHGKNPFRWRWILMKHSRSASLHSMCTLQWTTPKIHANRQQMVKIFSAEKQLNVNDGKTISCRMKKNWSEKVILRCYWRARHFRRWIIPFKFVVIKIGCSICENLQLQLTGAENCFCQMLFRIFLNPHTVFAVDVVWWVNLPSKLFATANIFPSINLKSFEPSNTNYK